MRLDVRRRVPPFAAESRIRPRGGARNGELQQGEKKQGRAYPQRTFLHRRHITMLAAVLTASVISS